MHTHARSKQGEAHRDRQGHGGNGERGRLTDERNSWWSGWYAEEMINTDSIYENVNVSCDTNCFAFTGGLRGR